jgi:hypothetical protein
MLNSTFPRLDLIGLLTLEDQEFAIAKRSIPVFAKQRAASSGLQTIGSPRTLNDVLISTGQPVIW